MTVRVVPTKWPPLESELRSPEEPSNVRVRKTLTPRTEAEAHTAEGIANVLRYVGESGEAVESLLAWLEERANPRWDDALRSTLKTLAAIGDHYELARDGRI